VEESIRMTEDRDKLRKYVHGVWPTLGSRTAKEQNSFGDMQADEGRTKDRHTYRDTLIAILCIPVGGTVKDADRISCRSYKCNQIRLMW